MEILLDVFHQNEAKSFWTDHGSQEGIDRIFREGRRAANLVDVLVKHAHLVNGRRRGLKNGEVLHIVEFVEEFDEEIDRTLNVLHFFERVELAFFESEDGQQRDHLADDGLSIVDRPAPVQIGQIGSTQQGVDVRGQLAEELLDVIAWNPFDRKFTRGLHDHAQADGEILRIDTVDLGAAVQPGCHAGDPLEKWIDFL